MANPYVNKVSINGNTVIDLTGDTVTPQTLMSGTTAHSASGAAITGTASPPPYDHSALINRDAADQHPISAITGLKDELDVTSTELSSVRKLFPVSFNHFNGKVYRGQQWTHVVGETAVLEPRAGSYNSIGPIPIDTAIHLRFRANQRPWLWALLDKDKKVLVADTNLYYAFSLKSNNVYGAYVVLTFNTTAIDFSNLMIAYTDETSGATTDKWNQLFPGIGYVPYELSRRNPLIKTAMDSVAVIGTDYYLGEKSAVSVTLPSGASVGDKITVSWYNGATPATLSVSGSAVCDYRPIATSYSKLTAEYNGTLWTVFAETIPL